MLIQMQTIHNMGNTTMPCGNSKFRPCWGRNGRSAVNCTPCLVMACDGVLLAMKYLILQLAIDYTIVY